MTSPASGTDSVIEQDGHRYRLAVVRSAHLTKDARILHEEKAPPALIGLTARIGHIPDAERASIEAVAPVLKPEPYQLDPWRIVALPEATIYNYTRTEGMVVTRNGDFVRETRGSPMVFPDNPYIRSPDREKWFFREDTAPSGQFDRAFLAFDPATHNYAHFLGVYLQRVMAATPHLRNTAILFPDVPDYKERHPGAMRNDFFFRLPEIHPLTNGNFYAPVPPGKWSVRELVMFQHVRNRWDLMFYPAVAAGFDNIAKEALRRQALLHGGGTVDNVYVSRRLATRRRIVNEDVVQAALQAEGFKTVYLETMDFWAQAAIFAGARKIVALHGAGCANILFSQGADFLEIHPAPLPSLQFAHSAVARHCTYSALGSRPLNKAKDIEVDMETFTKSLAHLLR